MRGHDEFYTPTALERTGRFLAVDQTATDVPIVIYGTWAVTNNKIDPTQLSAAQQAVFRKWRKCLNLFPLPNVPGFGSNGIGLQLFELRFRTRIPARRHFPRRLSNQSQQPPVRALDSQPRRTPAPSAPFSRAVWDLCLLVGDQFPRWLHPEASRVGIFRSTCSARSLRLC